MTNVPDTGINVRLFGRLEPLYAQDRVRFSTTLMPSENKTLVRRISLDDVKKHMDDMVFLDARSATALKRNPEQVPGAVHVPLKELDKRAKRLPRNRTLVTYCT